MIKVEAYRVLDNHFVRIGQVLEKYPNDYDFGFDIFDERKWYQYIHERYDGKIKDTEYGIPIAVRVYILGFSNVFAESIPEDRRYVYKQGNKRLRRSIFSLFPKADEYNKKDTSIAIIDKGIRLSERGRY